MAGSRKFPHERLIVYQKAIDFVAWTQPLIENLPGKSSVRDQLDRASNSIPLNIAEGNVKSSLKDRGRYWQIAMGSTVECAAALDVAVARTFVQDRLAEEGKSTLLDIANMLGALLNRIGSSIVSEDSPEYGIVDEDEDEDDDEDGSAGSGRTP